MIKWLILRQSTFIKICMKIYNTLTKQKEIFKPIKDKKVNLFVCGPTVYDYSHLGHAKTYTQFDFIVRYLRHRGFDVFYLQNITDIDDKILKRAKESNIPWNKLTRKYEKLYIEDMKKLHNTSVSKYARATDYIDQIVNQVKILMKKGYAYTINDGIYFEISKFTEYGKLSGRTELKQDDSVSRIDENSQKKGWNDFCLWKFSKPGEPFWKTEIGTGRPGWHIEDTAITEKFFGPQYDIHGGAVDLIIPHHEAEIAQMEAASGKEPLVRYWLHTGFLNIDSQKMSKSKGNFTTIRDALKKCDYRILRFLFLSGHYRSSLDLNEKNLKQAGEALHRIDEFIFNMVNTNIDDGQNINEIKKLKEGLYKDLDDDFNTPEALAKIFDFIRIQNSSGMAGKRTLEFFKDINLIFDFMDFEVYPDNDIEKLIKQRDVYRLAGDFKKSDDIRKQLEQKGIKIYDKESKTLWRRI